MSLKKLKARYEKIKFPVYEGSFSSLSELFSTFPGLKRHFENAEKSCRLDIVPLIRYINYMYDPDSNLMEEFPDNLDFRKRVAAIDAGYDINPNDEEIPEHIQAVFSFEDKEAVSFILDFLKVHKNNVWRDWVVTEEELNQLYELRAMPMKSMDMLNISRRSTLDEQCSSKIQAIVRLKRQFYAEHSDLQSKTENKIIPLLPENVFKVLDIDEKEFQYRQVNDVS